MIEVVQQLINLERALLNPVVRRSVTDLTIFPTQTYRRSELTCSRTVTATRPGSSGAEPGSTANDDVLPGDVGGVIGEEERHGRWDLAGVPQALERDPAAVPCLTAVTCSGGSPVLPMIGVSIAPRLTAFTRILRGASSTAKDGIMVNNAPRLPAATPAPARPRVAPMPTVTTTEAPSVSSGSAFCRVKNCPLALTSNNRFQVASSTASMGFVERSRRSGTGQ